MSRYGLVVSASRPEVAKGRLGTGPVKPLKNGPFKGVSLLGLGAAVTGKVAYYVTTEPIIWYCRKVGDDMLQTTGATGVPPVAIGAQSERMLFQPATGKMPVAPVSPSPTLRQYHILNYRPFFFQHGLVHFFRHNTMDWSAF